MSAREAKLKRIASRNVALDGELIQTVSSILSAVRECGDSAVIDYTLRFDGIDLRDIGLRVTTQTLKKSAESVDQKFLKAIRESINRVRNFHLRQREESWVFESGHGALLGQRISPIESAGLYAPGGTASYPSSVIMNVVPAQVAGVKRIVVITPPRTLSENPAVAATLLELGVEEIYRVGGAQGIAALAFGTESIERVDKITGPGNKYVAAAKKLVFGVVGIDSIAGPSEIVIIADDTARADFVAADLLAQAEHAQDASAILVTVSEALARAVAVEVVRQAENLPRRAIVQKSLENYGAIFIVNSMDEACELVNRLAPEHLELITDDDRAVGDNIRHAGAIFFGAHTPEAVGDYFAGPNHVLPTGGSARFSSALGVYDFVKRTSILSYSCDELNSSAEMIATLAEAEGLQAHANSVLIRMKSGNVVGSA
ncbi:MAG: histidinol dehydrogenase [Pyrinomonadaceae bacterium]